MGYADGPYAGIPYGSMGPATSTDYASRALPTAVGSPLIESGDYVLKSNGCLEGSSAPLEEVAFLLSTIPDTFITPDGIQRGNMVFRLTSWVDRNVNQVQNLVLDALQTALDRGSITDVVVTPSPYLHDNNTAVLDYVVTFKPTGIISG